MLFDAYGIQADFRAYDWSRVPKDVLSATGDFTHFANALSAKAEQMGRCVAFVGHSAGAAIVYKAAAEGVRMGYMGTLGLPTFGRGKPRAVGIWGNFYTSTHVDDVAGFLWGSRMGADVNVNLRSAHKDFWEAEAVWNHTAAGIAATWRSC